MTPGEVSKRLLRAEFRQSDPTRGLRSVCYDAGRSRHLHAPIGLTG